VKKILFITLACWAVLSPVLLSPRLAQAETHPCVEAYARCIALAMSADASILKTAAMLQRCEALYVACLFVYAM